MGTKMQVLFLFLAITSLIQATDYFDVHDLKLNPNAMWTWDNTNVPENNGNQSTGGIPLTPPQMNSTNGTMMNATAGPLRITFNTAQLRDLVTEESYIYIQKVLNIVRNFYWDLIKIYNVDGNLFWPTAGNYTHCYNALIPDDDRTLGVERSDLHVYVNGVYDFEGDYEPYLAFGASCIIGPRPIFAYLELNLAEFWNLDFNSPADFEIITNEVIKQFVHILGFSSDLFPYWLNSTMNIQTMDQVIMQNQLYRGSNYSLLITPMVLNATINYYNCSSVLGMQLENAFNLSGPVASVWEKTILYNDLLTASDVPGVLYFSQFDIAVLMDTNFYFFVDTTMADNIQWGKGKGCGFFENACFDNVTYQEFTTPMGSQCTFDYDGVGATSTSILFDDCFYVEPLPLFICDNPLDLSSWFYPLNPTQVFNYNSKCIFNSVVNNTILNGGPYNNLFNGTCQQYVCIPPTTTVTTNVTTTNATMNGTTTNATTTNATMNGTTTNVTMNGTTPNLTTSTDPPATMDVTQLIIMFGLDNVTCTIDGEWIAAPTGWGGMVQCPQDIIRYCGQYTSCPNFCSRNGVCVNGVCMCSPGYEGNDCNTQMYNITSVFWSDNGKEYMISADGELLSIYHDKFIDGEGESGQPNGPDNNNAGTMQPLHDGEDWGPYQEEAAANSTYGT